MLESPVRDGGGGALSPFIGSPSGARIADSLNRALLAGAANTSSAAWVNRTFAPIYSLLDFIGQGSGFAYDPTDGYFVKEGGGLLPGFGVTGTWILQGLNWTNLSTASTPPPRLFPAMTWDYSDNSILLFGGMWEPSPSTSFVTLSDTWTYRSGSWSKVPAPQGPSGRYGTAVAYDPALGGVLLFGGSNGTAALNDSWLYHNGTWTPELGWTEPTPRYGAMMAWDNRSGSLILFGGSVQSANSSATAPVNDTWVLGTGGWVRQSTGGSVPPSRELGVMTNDSVAGEILLVGGFNSTLQGLTDTWTYQAGTWTLHPLAGSPAVGWGGGAFDSRSGDVVTECPVVMGSSLTQWGGETWRYAQGNWTYQEKVGFPGPLVLPAVSTDPSLGGVLLSGGVNASGAFPNGTWLYRNDLWTDIAPVVGPPDRFGAGLVYDPTLGGDLLFGGANLTADLNDTWIFRAGAWSLLPEASAPTPRASSAMAYDPTSRDVVLFGGGNQSAVFNDTWTLGSNGVWSRSASMGPTARSASGLAVDSSGGLLLFGGDNSTSPTSGGFPLNDSWVWGTGGWTQLHPARSPSARSGFGLVYDPAIGSDVLYAGGNATQLFSDTWEFSAGTWEPAASATNPGALGAPAVAYDPSSGTVFDFGGLGIGGSPPAILVYATGWFFDPMALSVSSSSTSGAAPVAIQFSATLAGGASTVTGNWSFGDGGRSSLANTSHVYYTGGSYPATFTATDRLGSTVSASITETISGAGVTPLTTTASALPASGTAPLNVTLTADPQGGVAPYTYSWVLGDGGTALSREVNHTYSAPGNFTALVQVTDSLGGTVDAQVLVEVAAAPPLPLVLGLIDTPASGPAPLTVSFEGTRTGGVPPFVDTWAFGDGQNASGLTVTHTYSAAGNYTVTFTVAEANGIRAEKTTVVDVTGGGTVPPARNASGPPSSNATESAWPPWLVPLAIGIVLVAGVAVLVTLLRRRPPRRPEPPAPEAPPEWDESATGAESPIES